ncbi:MAG TPA: T9SS type A sorting domain-containing protein [Lacibacter sp.]|nr:T9SS type A sorting domain-containing protein [Lacibacter sp.]
MFLRLFGLLFAWLLPVCLMAQSAGDYQSNAATMNWNATASWQRWDGTQWVSNPSQGYPGQNTGTGRVTIRNGHTTTHNISPANALGSLLVEDGATLALGGFNLIVNGTTTIGQGASGTISFSSATGTRRFIGLVTVQSGASWTNTANSTVEFRGGLHNFGTFTAGTAIHTFSTNAQSLQGVLTIPQVTTTISLTNLQHLTVTASLAGAGALIQGAGAELNIGGTTPVTTLTATAAGNTVRYTGGNQTLKVTSYHNLELTGTGAKTMGTISTIGGRLLVAGTTTATAGAALAVTGDVVLESGTFTAGNFTHAIGGNWINNGAVFTTGTGTIRFNGTADQEIRGTALNQLFRNLTVDKASGALLIAGSTTILNATGNVLLSSGTFGAGTAVMIHVAGNWTNNGAVFLPGTGSTIFNGTTQTIGGSQGTHFNNLIIGSSSTTTAAVNLTVGSELTCTGIFDLVTFTCNRTAAGGSLNVTGTLRLRGTTGGENGSNFPAQFASYNLDFGTVEYNAVGGATQTIYAAPFYGNLVFTRQSGTGNSFRVAGGNLSVAGNFTINGNTLFEAGSFTHSLEGNLTIIGSFVRGTSTVEMNGGTQTIGGSTATTFHNLVIQSGIHTQINTGNTAVAGQLLVPQEKLLRIGGVTVILNAGATGSIAGTLRILQPGRLNTNNNLVFEAGGRYQHDWQTVEGFVPFATWQDGSICEIVGFTGDNSPNTFFAANGYSQSFYDFEWNCPNQGSGNIITMSGTLSTVRNNFTIRSTGAGIFRLGATSAGDLSIGGNFLQQAGTFQVTASSARVMTVAGDFTVQAGTFNLSANGNATVNVAGNCTFSSGSAITETGSSTGSGFVFNGSENPQVFTSGGTVSNTIHYTVNSGAYLQMATAATTVTSGTGGTFLLQSGATLGVTASDGITTTGAAGNIRVPGARTYSAGAHYIYNGTTSQVAGSGLTQNIPGNLTIDNSGNTVSLSANTTISGNLLISQGTFSSSASSFNFSLGGNWTNNGSYSPQTNTVNFASTTAPQAIAGTSVTTFHNLTNNNTNAVGLSLQNVDAVVNNMLNLNSATNGRFTIGANNLTIGSGGSIQNASASKYIVSAPTTSTNGRLRQNNLPAAARLYPLGTATNYLPLTLSPQAAGSDYSASVFIGTTTSGLPGGSAFDPRIHQVNAVWWIGQPAGTSAATLRFSWGADALEGSVFTTQPDGRIGVWRKDQLSSPLWSLTGQGFNNSNTSNFSEAVQVNALGGAEGYPYIVATNFVLPGVLKTFRASAGTAGNTLYWEMEGAEGIQYFEVEGGNNGRDFTFLARVSSGRQGSYTYLDPVSGQSVRYYRLRMVDQQANATYSKVVTVGGNAVQGLVLLQNPVSGSLGFRHAVASQTAQYQVVDMQGKLLRQGRVQQGANMTFVNLDQLPAGTYVLRYTDGGQQYATMFVRQ